MSSTFFGLETARSALSASQTALNVVAQNMSNVNTEGYTKQSANLASANYSDGVSKLSPLASANIGQGVNVSKISQMRDDFLDISYRNANSDSTKWSTELSALKDVESTFDETSNKGLNTLLGKFYEQLQSLSTNTESSEYYSLARSSAQSVTQVLNEYSSQLSKTKDEQLTSFNITTDKLNQTVEKINAVNQLIKDQTVKGSVSNELLDSRNSYIDTLSGYMNIDVTKNTDGTVGITSTDGIDVLDSTFAIDSSGDTVVFQETNSSDGTTSEFTPDGGQIAGYLNVLNGVGSYAEDGENDYKGIEYYKTALDNLATAFVGTFNKINTIDYSNSQELFTGTTASDIALSSGWIADPKYLVVANQGTNDNIVKMVNAMDNDIDTETYSGVSGNFEGFATTLISDIAQDVSYHDDMNTMYSSISQTATNQRESVVGVSTDEETINMTSYQKAYQAAARFMTVMDENLDVLINKMGTVGR